MQSQYVKLCIFTPITHADLIRKTLGESGAGKIGNYDFCSFSTKGIGRFRGDQSTQPHIGTQLQYESVEEEKIEVLVERTHLKDILLAVRAVHPYEEMAFDVYPLEDTISYV